VGDVMSAVLTVVEEGRRLDFTHDDLLRYHGGGSPGGVAHAFKVLERVLPLLAGGDPPERREITVETAFGGPGARDGFELVTRAVSDGRYAVNPDLARAELPVTRARFTFRLRLGECTVTAVLRDGFVTEEFVALVDREQRTAAERDRLEVLKGELAERLLSAAAADVYDVEP
jgi:hypothetical protein